MVMRTEMMVEGRRVIRELEQGRELANRLLNNLKRPSSDETNQSLISEILCSYGKAIFLLGAQTKNVFKKRKISEKESEKVKVCVGEGQDGACVEDGYFWRKYGQKEILGSKNPRGYYRCTHRFTQGCLAVKQVQRSDTDPSVFQVKYLGTHTCNVTPAAAAAAASDVSVRESEHEQQGKEQIEDIINVKPTKSEEMMLNLDELENKEAIFRTFSFSSRPEPETAEWRSGIFLENLSPATFASVITTQELISAPASVTNSPTGDSYLSSLDNIFDFDTDFSFHSYLELLS